MKNSLLKQTRIADLPRPIELRGLRTAGAACSLLVLAAAGLPLSAQSQWDDQAQLAAQPPSEVHFKLFANPKFVSCLGVPGEAGPTATVTVIRGELNDTLQINAHHLKPNLAFDLFTTQNSNLNPYGQVDPTSKNFGLAWYQTDFKADENGDAEVQIHTILLDQIFGFDPVVNLPPTHTFHVGFWFNNPADAAACGFNPKTPTPFNGEHKAGPNAMMSVPNALSGLGPLCSIAKGKVCDNQ